MPRKRRSRRYTVSLDNPDLVGSLFFARACHGDLQILAIACEFAFEAGFTDLLELYERSPDIAEKICDSARTALRGLAKLKAYNRASPLKAFKIPH
ncbi:MAG: hypothetical protein KGI97_00845 [Alphaproteobacteria bacterium]|nr:hypothetical protein [Alphaproteobacteria bacterium]